MNNKLIITLLGSCCFGLELKAATTGFITPNDNFGTIESIIAGTKGDNTLYRFIPPEVMKHFTDPLKYSAPPPHLRQVIAYPLWGDESNENNGESGTANISNNVDMMAMSIMAGSYYRDPGAELEGETRLQIAGSIDDMTELPVFRVDASQYPLFAEYLRTESHFTLYGSFPEAMLADIEYLLSLAVDEHKSIAAIPATAPIRYFFRWSRASRAIYTLKLMYDPANNYEEGLNRQRLKACLQNMNHVIPFYNLLDSLGIAENDLQFSVMFKTYLQNFVEGNFSIGETTVTADSQIVSLLFAAIISDSSLFKQLVEDTEVLSFSRTDYYKRRNENRRLYPELLRLLDQYFESLVLDDQKRKRLASAFIHMLLSEGILLQQLENSTLHGFDSTSGTSTRTQSPRALLAPGVMRILNSLASQGPETGASAAITVVALMHMPALITTFNDLARNQGHDITAYAAMARWLSTYFTSLQSGIARPQDIPLIRATLYSFFPQNSYSPHGASGDSRDPRLEGPITAVISEWLNNNQQNHEGFEAIEAAETLQGASYAGVVDDIAPAPAAIASQLITLYPSFYTRLARQPAFAHSGNQASRPDQSQKSAVEKVLAELTKVSSPREH